MANTELLVVALLVGVAASCRDDCDRAVARLQRIEAARPKPKPSRSDSKGLNPLLAMSPGERAELSLEACRNGQYAAYDPVLACALRSDTDEAAAACIDHMLADVIHGSPREAKPVPVVHEQRCGAVKATWHGLHDPTVGGDRWQSLVIEIDGRAKPWTQDLLELSEDARTTDLFSPDCRHVLLLTSRSGPYHVISTERMAAYLDGEKPDYVLDGERTRLPDGEGFTGPGLFYGGAWLSNTTVVYTWGCCDPPITTRFELPR